MHKDYYRILNVAHDASATDLQRSYRSLAWRYHPDRNPSPAAATLMTMINEAYEILGEPRKRFEYDRNNQKPDENVDAAILSAARDTLMKRGWTVIEDNNNEFTLKQGSRQVRIVLTPECTSTLIQRRLQRASAFCVVLAIRMDPRIKFPVLSIAVIDLMRSRLYAGEFPDSSYRDLFKSFLP